MLLSRRRGSYGDGMWHLPSGKLDAGESLLEAAIREAWEEIGVRIDAADLRHVHTLHAVAPGVEPRLGVFFEALAWRGEPENREPEKCSELGGSGSTTCQPTSSPTRPPACTPTAKLVRSEPSAGRRAGDARSQRTLRKLSAGMRRVSPVVTAISTASGSQVTRRRAGGSEPKAISTG